VRTKPRANKRRTDYEIGKGRPPVQTRWKPGQSGNPKGRPKASKNLKTIMLERLVQKIPVQERGKLRQVSVFEAIVMRMVNLALKGDQKAITFIMSMEDELTRYAAPAAKIPLNASPADIVKVYQAIVRQVKG
jgi:hypothetical protein